MKLMLCVIVAVKSKFAYAYSQEFPYRISHILECEFFLLEAMVTDAVALFCTVSVLHLDEMQYLPAASLLLCY